MPLLEDRQQFLLGPEVNDSVLVATDVEVQFGDGLNRRVTPLRGANVSCAPGRLVALTGRSGSGKSTLLNFCVGRLPPSATVVSGELTIDGVAVSGARTCR